MLFFLPALTSLIIKKILSNAKQNLQVQSKAEILGNSLFQQKKKYHGFLTKPVKYFYHIVCYQSFPFICFAILGSAGIL